MPLTAALVFTCARDGCGNVKTEDREVGIPDGLSAWTFDSAIIQLPRGWQVNDRELVCNKHRVEIAVTVTDKAPGTEDDPAVPPVRVPSAQP